MKLSIKLILLFLIIPFTATGCNKTSNFNTSSASNSTITSFPATIKITKVPIAKMNFGKSLDFLSFDGELEVLINDITIASMKFSDEKVVIDNVDFSSSSLILSIEDYQIYQYTTSFTGLTTINDNNGLLLSMKQNLEDQIVFLRNGDYNLSAANIFGKKLIIGEVVNDIRPKIIVSGDVSSQATLYFRDNVSIINVDFLTSGTYYALKFTAGTKAIEEVYLENITLFSNNSKGLNLQWIESAVLKNFSIQDLGEDFLIALSVNDAKVSLIDSELPAGSWGSIGVMDINQEPEIEPIISKVIINNNSVIRGIAYIENVAKYGEIEIFEVDPLIYNTIALASGAQIYSQTLIVDFASIPSLMFTAPVLWYADEEYQIKLTEDNFPHCQIIYFAYSLIITGKVILSS